MHLRSGGPSFNTSRKKENLDISSRSWPWNHSNMKWTLVPSPTAIKGTMSTTMLNAEIKTNRKKGRIACVQIFSFLLFLCINISACSVNSVDKKKKRLISWEDSGRNALVRKFKGVLRHRNTPPGYTPGSQYYYCGAGEGSELNYGAVLLCREECHYYDWTVCKSSWHVHRFFMEPDTSCNAI